MGNLKMGNDGEKYGKLLESEVLIAVDATLFRIVLVCTAVIVVKFIATSTIQGGLKTEAGTRAPEDKFGGRKQSFQAPSKVDDPILKSALERADRWNRIVANDVENLPMGLIVLWASMMSAYWPNFQACCTIVWCVARCGHTTAFSFGLQPHRTVCWLCATLSILIMLCNGLYGAFSLV